MQTNRTVENIGARRLHTVIERIVEEISFDAPDKAGLAFSIDEVRHAAYTLTQLINMLTFSLHIFPCFPFIRIT